MVIEKIEDVKFFARWEERWKRPMGFWSRWGNIFVNPAKAFWDIRHDENRKSAALVLILNAVLYGLLSLAVVSHVHITSWQGLTVPFQAQMFLFLPINTGLFTSFFLVGLVYYFLFFYFINFLFTRAAVLAGYAGDRKKKVFPVTLYGLTPTLVIGVVDILLVLVALPNFDVSIPSRTGSNITANGQELVSALNGLFYGAEGKPLLVWTAIDIINILTYVVWIPITMTIAMRELYEISTAKMYGASVACGVLVVIVFFVSRFTIAAVF
ncbi:MAG: hypothetical protein ACTSU5_21860 [Promethearchaeota archaeon]